MAPPVHTILGLTPELFDRDVGVARRAATTIDALLRGAPISLMSALDRGFRDARLHRQLGLNFIDLEPVQVARLERLGPLRGTGVAIASLVRSGHVREVAVRWLCTWDDPRALAFLIHRLNDYVGGIAGLAWQGLERRLQPVHAPLFVHCLPLLGRMATWVRAAPARQKQLRELLLRPHPACRQALWDGLRERDAEVMLESAKLLAAVYLGQPEMRGVLTAALSVRDQRTRLWAARLAVDAVCTPREVLFELVARLETDRSPAIRALGLEGRALQGDRAGIERACFDTGAAIRFRARAVLADMFARIGHPPLDYRGLALATLGSGTAGRDELIAALGTLAEFGRVEDLEMVTRFVGDARRKVAREVARTLASLARLSG